MLKLLTIASPLGRLRLLEREDALAGVYLPTGETPTPVDAIEETTPLLELVAAQLAAYFAGERHDFDVPLAPRGTGFQELVWRELVAIPFAQTRSYGELARSIGRPSSSRAVGSANSKNPISIIVPCHRVIGSTGELTGYAGGMAAKRWLLDHERRFGIQPQTTLAI